MYNKPNVQCSANCRVLIIVISNVHNPQALNRCSKLWLQVSKNFRRRTYAIFQQFTVHCTRYTCTLYVTRKHLKILIFDFSLKITAFSPPSSECISGSQYYLIVQLKSMGKRMAILIIYYHSWNNLRRKMFSMDLDGNA